MMGHVGMLLWCLLAVGLLVSWVWRVLAALLWRPLALTRSFARQGVRGPPYRFFSGSLGEIRAMNAAARRVVLDVHSHDITHRVMPHYYRWSSQYGETFLFWFGPQPRISITDVEMAKQVLSKFSFYPKENVRPSLLALLGKGLVLVEGLDWVRHRRVVSPAFTMDKLKGMTQKMAECTMSMLDGWRDQVVKGSGMHREIEMDNQFQELTANVISHTAFGSSYAEGKEVFLAQRDLQLMVFATAFDVPLPGLQYLPTRANLQRWRLERRVRGKLGSIIRRRLGSDSPSYGDDLLGLMMDACRMDGDDGGQGSLRLDMDEIIDECKTFFFAGHETTSHLLTWAVFLLSSNAEWQEKLREEVLRECGVVGVPDAERLGKLKLTNMVLLEALRLYPPVTMMIRRTGQDIKLGGLAVPKGTVITIPVAMIHRKEELWGAGASDFNPLRFENGVSRAAKHPSALLAFSVGPRSCVGQSFAMLEAKLVMAMILQRFSFTLSPRYKHAPTAILTLQPQYGLPVVITPLLHT